MSEMIERVAKIIASAAECYNEGRSLDWLDFEDEARAAIAAMREPSEAMLGAHLAYCEERYKFGNSPTIIHSWQAMIDAALAVTELEVDSLVIQKALGYRCSKCGATKGELCVEEGVATLGVHPERVLGEKK